MGNKDRFAAGDRGEAQRLVKGRLLLASADPGQRRAVARQLRAAGHQVDEVATGIEALGALCPEHHMVILDLSLSDMDARDLCRHVKDNPTGSQVMVLALAGVEVTPKDPAAWLDLGADSYLELPVETEVLLASVNALIRTWRVIDQHDLQRELFLATVSHDLRNRLSAIRLGVKVLDSSPTLGDHERGVLERMLRSCALMQDLLDQVLRFIQSLAGGRSLEIEPLDIVELAEGLLTAGLDPEGRVTIAASEPVVAPINRVAFSQLLQNLMVNALEHGVGEVTVRIEAVGQKAVVRVHNRGPAIGPDKLARLFAPFEKDGGRCGGFGLGLFIVHRIATDHGGRVEVSSTDRDGTELTVAIPR